MSYYIYIYIYGKPAFPPHDQTEANLVGIYRCKNRPVGSNHKGHVHLHHLVSDYAPGISYFNRAHQCLTGSESCRGDLNDEIIGIFGIRLDIKC